MDMNERRREENGTDYEDCRDRGQLDGLCITHHTIDESRSDDGRLAWRVAYRCDGMPYSISLPFARERDAELALNAAQELGIFHGTQEECLARAQRYGTEQIKKLMLDALQW